MAKVSFTPALSAEYENLFNTCVITDGRLPEVEAVIAKLLTNQSRYAAVGDPFGIPWYFIAVIHNMEASLNFSKHLHNGDALTARTVHDPPGRPKTGNPPFTWEESAADALTMRGLGKVTDWSLAGTLYQLEGYNGWGYRLYHPHVKSPYLWSGSNLYTSGKYVADGTWSDTARSAQCGAAVLLRRMAEKGQIEFTDQPSPPADTPPLVVNFSIHKSADPKIVAQTETLQQWLNTFPGVFVKVDGIPGEKTSDAYQKVTGGYLPGDPRG